MSCFEIKGSSRGAKISRLQKSLHPAAPGENEALARLREIAGWLAIRVMTTMEFQKWPSAAVQSSRRY
jgi:hypothetical protein